MSLSSLLEELSALTEVKLNPPASESQISESEKQLGFSLPDPIKEFLLIANGQGENTGNKTLGLVAGGELHSAKKIAEWHQFCREEFSDGNEFLDSPYVVHENYEQWIPITWGYDLQFLFFDPSPADRGVKGQILLSSPIYGDSKVVAFSFTDLLQRIVERIEINEDGDIDLSLSDLPAIDPQEVLGLGQ